MSSDCCGDNSDGPSPVETNDTTAPALAWHRDTQLRLPILSGLLLLAGYALEWSGIALASTVVLAAGLLAGACTFVPGAVRRLVRGHLGVGLLMTIAATGAVLLGHVGEAAALAFLFSLAEALEERAMRRARHGLQALLSLIPDTAIVHRHGIEQPIRAADLRKHDVLIVRPGERVATDGTVVDGYSSIDTSAITGESIPVGVSPGDDVPAGSINGSAALRIEAAADGRDNSLTTIVRIVEQANAQKGAHARLADRIARPLVPAVLAAAALVVVFGFVIGEPAVWTERALVVLVAASPCALALAVPVTVISAIGAASRLGVIVKSGAAFEQLGAIGIVAFDKTGTLTRGTPEVVAVETIGPYGHDDILAIAAGLERDSTHPLGAALRAAANHTRKLTNITEHSGRGVTGMLGIDGVRIGSPRWVAPGPLAAATERLEAAGMSVVVVEIAACPAGVIGIRDELKPEASQAIHNLHIAGFETVMLTGDNTRTAEVLAREAGIESVRAELLPADKVTAVEALRTRRPTAMIGDGINDAPALATADVGIAMGLTGSDVAVESAGVAFTGTDLRLIPTALLHARRGRRIMTENIALSILVIGVLLPLALFGVLGLAGIVLVHELAEVVIILNGVRAARTPDAAHPNPTAEGTRMTHSGPFESLPLACTLSPGAGEQQLARWRRFDQQYELDREYAGTRLTIRYAKVEDSVQRLRELVATESHCCSFVAWRIDEGHADLRLVVDGTPDQLAALSIR